MPLPKVKICCISSEEEAELAVSYGASAIGLVGPIPDEEPKITNEDIARISQSVPPPIASFLLTSETSTNSIIKHHEEVHTPVIQLVGDVPTTAYKNIRKQLPGVKLVQVLYVEDETAVDRAMEIAPHTDALLLDCGDPDTEGKILGRKENPHNWEIARTIVQESTVPVFLSGELNTHNISQAIDVVQPYGIDVCTGVRSGDELDKQKLYALMQTVGY